MASHLARRRLPSEENPGTWALPARSAWGDLMDPCCCERDIMKENLFKGEQTIIMKQLNILHQLKLHRPS